MLVFQNEPAFVIHKRSYRETSSLVQFLTPAHGRITVVARLSSRLVGKTLQPFIPAELSCSGRSQLLNLRDFNPEGAGLLHTTEQRMVGLYVNELLTRLTPPASPSLSLFDLYRQCLFDLADDDAEIEPLLRRFELSLLELTGNGVQLEHEHDSLEPIRMDAHYHYEPGLGPVRNAHAGGGRPAYQGRTLIMLRGQLDEYDNQAMSEAKQLLRAVIDYHLRGRAIHTRAIFEYLRKLT